MAEYKELKPMRYEKGTCVYCHKDVFPYKPGEVENKTVWDVNDHVGLVFWHTQCKPLKPLKP